MKILISLLFLIACTPIHQGHSIHIDNVHNFAREIYDTGRPIDMNWINVLKRQHVESGNGKPALRAIQAINVNCNNKPYKNNPAWPTPKEFAIANNGDCKGFAICKYYALRRAGFKADQLNLWSGDYDGHSHMILVAELDNKEYVLDIGAESGLPLAKDYFYKHFQPSYRFNENGWDVN